MPILSTLPKKQAIGLSLIVGLSRKLSAVPSMFVQISQSKYDSSLWRKYQRSQRACHANKGIRMSSRYNHRLRIWEKKAGAKNF
jgi:hypothetical protein